METKHNASTDSDSFGKKLAAFLSTVRIPVQLPNEIVAMDTLQRPSVQRVVGEFCERYYTGSHLRKAVWGINPGRFGAGMTGLSFTDPHMLAELGIQSDIVGRRELSAEFIENVIDECGGASKFYQHAFLGAVCPVGLMLNDKNINFYDDAKLEHDIAPFNQHCMSTITSFGLRTDKCVVLGTGKFKQVFERRYRTGTGYQEVTYLEHPRFVMQYRRKRMKEYIDRYVNALAE